MNLKFDYQRINYWREVLKHPHENSTDRLIGAGRLQSQKDASAPRPQEGNTLQARPCPDAG